MDLTKAHKILVAGAGHGIGLALVRELLQGFRSVRVYGTFRDLDRATSLFETQKEHPGRLELLQLDGTREQDYGRLPGWLGQGGIDGILNCIGALHTEGLVAEKSLQQTSLSSLREAFCINAIPTVLFARELKSHFQHGRPSFFACLSARVGSIQDNRSGGWFGYRASKAALNMYVRNIALEYERYRCRTLVLALHPGTTDTDLSKPFSSRSRYELHTPAATAKNLLKVIEDLPYEETGSFYDWKGHRVPW